MIPPIVYLCQMGNMSILVKLQKMFLDMIQEDF